MQVIAPMADINALIDSLEIVTEQTSLIAARAALHEAEYELPITRDRVPIGPTGQLRLSGRVQLVDSPEIDVLAVAIAYGGPPGAGLNDMEVDYALPVHENLTARHPIGEAKWVERTVREEMESGGAAGRMSREITAELQKLALLMGGRYKSRSGSYLRAPAGGRLIGSTPNLTQEGI